MFAAWNRRPVIITQNSAARVTDTTNIKWSNIRVRRYYEITSAFVFCRQILKMWLYSVELENAPELWTWTVLKWSGFSLFTVRFRNVTGGKVEKPIWWPRFEPEYSRIRCTSANNFGSSSQSQQKDAPRFLSTATQRASPWCTGDMTNGKCSKSKLYQCPWWECGNTIQ